MSDLLSHDFLDLYYLSLDWILHFVNPPYILDHLDLQPCKNDFTQKHNPYLNFILQPHMLVVPVAHAPADKNIITWNNSITMHKMIHLMSYVCVCVCMHTPSFLIITSLQIRYDLMYFYLKNTMFYFALRLSCTFLNFMWTIKTAEMTTENPIAANYHKFR